jgi:hypothetical protein
MTAACARPAKRPTPRLARPCWACGAGRGPDRRTSWPLTAGIDHDGDAGVLAATAPRSLGLDRGLAMHPTRPDGPGPQRAALPVADGGGLDGALLLLPGDERPPPRPFGLWPADLGLGAVQAQLDALGLGVGEHVRQGAQPHPWHVGDGKAAPGQQRPDLTDSAWSGPLTWGLIAWQLTAKGVRPLTTTVQVGPDSQDGPCRDRRSQPMPCIRPAR